MNLKGKLSRETHLTFRRLVEIICIYFAFNQFYVNQVLRILFSFCLGVDVGHNKKPVCLLSMIPSPRNRTQVSWHEFSEA